jgi:hypothetical protein
MKRGLVSPNQILRSQQIWPLQTVQGAPLGAYIVDVVPTGTEYTVALPLFWVDVPDTAQGYTYYWDSVAELAIEITQTLYWLTEDISFFGSQAEAVRIIPATGTQPANTTNEQPLVGGEGSGLYWYDNQWVNSWFSPEVYTTVPEAQEYLIQQTNVVAAGAVNTQLRAYSLIQVLSAPAPTDLISFDYAPMNIVDYQAFIDVQVAARDGIVNAATSLSDLFDFNPAELDTIP